MIQTVFFHFFYSLNDFLATAQKNKLVIYNLKGTPSVKDAIESIGVPHSEVDVIIANGSPVDFYYKLTGNDTIEVYPVNAKPLFENYSLTPKPQNPKTFVADVHLGRLAKTLRLLGFDTVYENNFSDKTIVDLAEREDRIILTRDIGLLKHKSIKWGYWLRSQVTEIQLEEVVKRFDLLPHIAIFKRCLSCNGKIEEVEKEAVLEKLPPKTIQYFTDFFQCSVCKKVYWKGSHYEHMVETVKRTLDKYQH